MFLCSSATIANPRELAERLIEEPLEIVEKSGAPRGEKYFVFVNPPVVNQQLGIRRSYLSETRRVAVTMRTPGADLELAAGFVLGEAIVPNRAAIRVRTWGACPR